MLTIVIVNWNSGVQLLQALQSIDAHHEGLVDLVVVVDNGSTDDSLQGLRSLGDLPFTLSIVENRENRGFGAACNQGAAQARSPFLLFLNPDARLYAGSLLAPLEFMQRPENAGVGISSIQLVDDAGAVARSCARAPRAHHFFAQAFGIDRRFPRIGHYMREWDHRDTRIVDQVIGAFFVVRTNLFERLGGFDERFFVYFEEVDFSVRARQAGSSSVYVAGASAYHAGGGTSYQIKGRRLFYSLRSRLQYGHKHFGALEFGSLVIVSLLVEPLARVAHALLRGHPGDARHVVEAYTLLARHAFERKRA